ncbi:ninjurin-2-like isoform X3 [Homalodisca vitripennis]|uniref:ninjurin-2-like isoform X3 n=1 Tax=Homalodisca vitripennis TaxID=197043 RepID=UPI001EECD015|nr:ninjurin-2-like isoform X3 [Homalodisca vitripennis]
MAAILAGGTENKLLDANRYATKKTIAQGMLDIALLTANASQLKYILQVGDRHEFYSLMLGLITTSIILQVVSASLETILSRLNLNKPESQKVAVYMNHALVGCIMLTLVVNVVKMSFGLDPAA